MQNSNLEDLLQMIPVGKTDAISRYDLCRQLKMPDRTVRQLIHDARMIHPILSNTESGGYYLPATKEEAEEFINQQNSYISNINRTIAPVRRWIERQGQRRLRDIDNKEYTGQIAGF